MLPEVPLLPPLPEGGVRTTKPPGLFVDWA